MWTDQNSESPPVRGLQVIARGMPARWQRRDLVLIGRLVGKVKRKLCNHLEPLRFLPHDAAGEGIQPCSHHLRGGREDSNLDESVKAVGSLAKDYSQTIFWHVTRRYNGKPYTEWSCKLLE